MASNSATSDFTDRHLLGIEGLSPIEITALLDTAERYVDQNRQANKKSELLQGRTVINLFFEDSTRPEHHLSWRVKGSARM